MYLYYGAFVPGRIYNQGLVKYTNCYQHVHPDAKI